MASTAIDPAPRSVSELTTSLLDWIALNPVWSGVAIFLVAMFESLAIVGLIVPGALMMVGFGALIGSGTLEFWPIVAWAIAGAIAGDGISFMIGYHFSHNITTTWPFSRYPHMLEQGIIFFHRHGGISIALGRFFGPVRAVVPLVAGMMGMSPALYVVANVLSALAWAPLYLLPGIALGSALDLAAGAVVRIIIFAGLLLLLGWGLFWSLHRWRPRTAPDLTALTLLLIGGILLLAIWQPGPALPKKELPQNAWLQQGWQQLPDRRSSHLWKGAPLNLQLSGNPQNLEIYLQAEGWGPGERLNWQNLLRVFSPALELERLPFIRQKHADQPEALLLQRPLSDQELLVLRLWPSGYRLLPDNTSLWIGKISLHQRLNLLDLLVLSVESDEALQGQQLQALLPQASLRQDKTGRSVLLLDQPSVP